MTFNIVAITIENPDLSKTEFKIFLSVALYLVACGRAEFEPINEYDVAILMKCLESHGHVNPGIAKSLAYAIFCNSVSMAKAKPDDEGPKIILS